MIQTLDDAWEWYQSVTRLRRYMGRLGAKYWTGESPIGEILASDHVLRGVEGPDIEKMVETVESDLADLGVLLLFSVFEAIVRERVRYDVDLSLSADLHPAVIDEIDDLRDHLEHGSFFRITRLFKGLDHDLVEEVNQVRRYRNWVSHGRRGPQPEYVSPPTAYNRLTRFLQRFATAPNEPRGDDQEPEKSTRR